MCPRPFHASAGLPQSNKEAAIRAMKADLTRMAVPQTRTRPGLQKKASDAARSPRAPLPKLVMLPKARKQPIDGRPRVIPIGTAGLAFPESPKYLV
jgi:hypothetical protein